MRPSQASQSATSALGSVQRIRLWYAFLLVVCVLFVVRLFYLQIIRHGHYRQAALQGQLKEYEIPPERGVIEAYDGEEVVPLVLNEKRYTLFADPVYITDVSATAQAVATILGGNPTDYENKMAKDTRYAVLAKKLPKEQRDKLSSLGIKGLGMREESYRTYPQGSLAAQLLGFVNDDGEGKYGLEQYLNDELKGVPGQSKAITDVQGVPLVANRDNILRDAKAGRRVALTIDVSMQRQLEDILKAGLDQARSTSGSAVILEAHTGAIKAMANYPTFNPAEFNKVEDASIFTNPVVSAPLEVGSIMKPLTAAAALDQGVVTPETTYYDPGFVKIDDKTITNVEEVGGAATRSVTEILTLSLNTGATYLLKQMGGGDINPQARTRWHEYMTNHYRLGKTTGIEQGYEAGGVIPDPLKGYGLNLQYANSAFGQGMTATPLQMAAAIASVVNGGTYYRPRLVEQLGDEQGNLARQAPIVVKHGVVSPQVGVQIQAMMEKVVARNNKPAVRAGYSVGGKTGTAQIAKPSGGYYEDRYNGMYMGFVGGNKPQYVIVVRVNEPQIPGYAGSRAAGPIFASLSNMLINNFAVTPKQ